MSDEDAFAYGRLLAKKEKVLAGISSGAALKAAVRCDAYLAAICAAPMVLDKAGLLENRRFTMYPAEDLYKYLRDSKRPQSDMTVSDGKVITGKGPGATAYFAAAVAEALEIPANIVKNVLDGMFVK